MNPLLFGKRAKNLDAFRDQERTFKRGLILETSIKFLQDNQRKANQQFMIEAIKIVMIAKDRDSFSQTEYDELTEDHGFPLLFLPSSGLIELFLCMNWSLALGQARQEIEEAAK